MKRYNSMLDPTINELKDKMNNRYLLVNVAAQRAAAVANRAAETDGIDPAGRFGRTELFEHLLRR